MSIENITTENIIETPDEAVLETPELEVAESELSKTAESEEMLEDIPERTVVFEEALEAILFAAGHPITYATIARVLEMTPGKVKDKVFEYALQYNNPEIPRGVILLTFADSCQLCTKETYLTEIREALGIRKSGTLSTSTLEALAIIAYNQPVTRAFVDTLRRVDSSYAVNNLLDRGLIHAVGRLDVPGRPMLYGTTSDFLRCFGLKDLDSLPKTSDELLEAFDNAKLAGEEKKDDDGVEQLTVDLEGAMPGADEAKAESVAEAEKAETTEDIFDLAGAEDDIFED